MDDKLDRELLRECLEGIIKDVFHERSSRIVRIDTRGHHYSSSFPSYIVSVQGTENLEHTIFLKDFGVYSRAVEKLEERRNREMHVYRDVLGDGGLGNPKYYGSLWDESQERYWLFMEFIDGTPINELGYELVLDAVRWLGRLHNYSVQNAQFLEDCTFLERHDHHFFQRTADAAHLTMSKFSPELAERVAPITSGYTPLVQAMTSQPPVFLHGSYRRAHILLDRRAQPPRLCPVDWESAALGAGLYDLAYLVDGFIPPQLDEIIDIYRAEAGKYGISIPPMDEVVYVMNCYRLHRNMKWLSWALNPKFPKEEVPDLVTRAERLARLVL